MRCHHACCASFRLSQYSIPVSDRYEHITRSKRNLDLLQLNPIVDTLETEGKRCGAGEVDIQNLCSISKSLVNISPLYMTNFNELSSYAYCAGMLEDSSGCYKGEREILSIDTRLLCAISMDNLCHGIRA